MEYTLMNKDREVLSFETETKEGITLIKNESIIDESLLPPGFDGNIKNYIEKRRAPKHRKHIAKLLHQLNADNIDGYIKVCNAASLTDTFWVSSSDNPLTWNDVSLYRNAFDENIARVAIDGGDASFGSTSPELSVDGQYAKCWIRDNGKLSLLKRGDPFFGEREVFAEYYSSQIVNKICTQAVSYNIVKYHDKIATKCPIFTSEDKGFLPISRLYPSNYGTEAVTFLESIQQYDDGDNYRRMVIADALILNIDRHLGNFGYLIDNDALKPLQMAPVFDFNRAMLFNLTDDQFQREDMNNLFAQPCTDGGFVPNAKSVLTDEIRADLKNLQGFTFCRSDIANWPDSRLDKYEQFIDFQINQILGQTKVIIHDAPSIKRTTPKATAFKKTNSPELEK